MKLVTKLTDETIVAALKAESQRKFGRGGPLGCAICARKFATPAGLVKHYREYHKMVTKEAGET